MQYFNIPIEVAQPIFNVYDYDKDGVIPNAHPQSYFDLIDSSSKRPLRGHAISVHSTMTLRSKLWRCSLCQFISIINILVVGERAIRFLEVHKRVLIIHKFKVTKKLFIKTYILDKIGWKFSTVRLHTLVTELCMLRQIETNNTWMVSKLHVGSMIKALASF